MSMMGQALSNWQRHDISLCRQDLLTMVTDEGEYEPTSSNPETKIDEVYKIDDIEITIKYIRPGVHEVSFLAPEGLSEETLTRIDNLIKEKIGISKLESASSNPEPVTVECPICSDIIEIPQYDAISRSDALLRHIEEKHIAPASEFHELMLHAVGEMFGPGGIVVDEARAKVTSCECIEYKPDKFWCTSKGVVGALTDEQEGLYCNPRVIVEKPALKERLTSFGEAVEYCRAQLPPTDGRTRLEIYLDCMSKQLAKAGIEA